MFPCTSVRDNTHACVPQPTFFCSHVIDFVLFGNGIKLNVYNNRVFTIEIYVCSMLLCFTAANGS